MQRLYQLLAGCAVAAVVVSSCSGGSGSSSSPVLNQPAPLPPAQGARNAIPVLPASARQSVGTAHLTLKLSPALVGKNAATVAVRQPRAAVRAAKRSPKYVDPMDPDCNCTGNILDIYVDETLIPNIDGRVGSNDSLYVQQSPDGTQSLAVPLYSTSQNNIVVVEWDGGHYEVLAAGETDLGAFSPGGNVSPTVTMLMNAKGVGILDIYNQQDPEFLSGEIYYGLNGSCTQGQPGSSAESQFGLYSADWLDEFVPVAGYGGTSQPVLTSVASDGGGSTKVAQTTIPGLFAVDWDANCNGVTLNVSAPNPAYPIYLSTTNFAGGYSNYGYYYCHEGTGSCPGGPYQGLWDMWWYDGEGYYVQNYIDAGTVTGSVDVTASPPP